LKRPRLLLLDEPFGALDPGIRRDMQELLHRLWQETGMTILMVTHDIAEAFKLGTRLVVFDKIRPDDPASSATITYDLPLKRAAVGGLAAQSVQAAKALDRTISIISHENTPQEGTAP